MIPLRARFHIARNSAESLLLDVAILAVNSHTWWLKQQSRRLDRRFQKAIDEYARTVRRT